MQPAKRTDDARGPAANGRFYPVVVPRGGEQTRGSRVEQAGLSRVLVLFARAVLLRCPVCGGGDILASWFRTKPRCPTCGFALEREEGYSSGAMAVNLIATELVLTAVL